jgi:hypothetical protein
MKLAADSPTLSSVKNLCRHQCLKGERGKERKRLRPTGRPMKPITTMKLIDIGEIKILAGPRNARTDRSWTTEDSRGSLRRRAVGVRASQEPDGVRTARTTRQRRRKPPRS